jgi:hypothetical protein
VPSTEFALLRIDRVDRCPFADITVRGTQHAPLQAGLLICFFLSFDEFMGSRLYWLWPGQDELAQIETYETAAKLQAVLRRFYPDIAASDEVAVFHFTVLTAW